MPSRASSTVRLFAALYPPPETAQALLEALGGLELPPHRLVPPGQVHLTLHFIGDTPSGRVDDVAETLRLAAGGIRAFELAPGRLVSLPARGRARLVAAETDRPPGLLELQRRLAGRLARGGARRDPGDRFRPHLTLCRFRSPRAMPAVDHEVAIAAFGVDRVVLVKSTLRPEGARHDELSSVALTAPGRS